MNSPEPPPEALLIERLRQQLPDGEDSISRAAKRAGISEGRWRQIAKGYQQVDKETRARVIAPAGTLARMAAAVSATAEDLERVGRRDAAAKLRKLQEAPQPALKPALVEVSNKDLVDEALRRMDEPVPVSALTTGELVGQIRELFGELRARVPEVAALINKTEDWPDAFLDGASDEPPTVRGSEDGDQGDQFGRG